MIKSSARFFYNKLFIFLDKRKKSSDFQQKQIDIGWGIAYCNALIEVRIDDLWANLRIFNDIITTRVKLSPHYDFVKSYLIKDDFNTNNSYLNYIKSFYSEIDYKSQIINFSKLIDNISDSILDRKHANNVEIVVMIGLGGKIIIIDGLHRASVLAGLGSEWISCNVCYKLVS
jgi:hypothetical protein